MHSDMDVYNTPATQKLKIIHTDATGNLNVSAAQ